MEFTLWWKLPPPFNKSLTSILFTVTERSQVWLKPNALWAYKYARWKPCCGIFCSRFHPILSPLKIILEMVFWTNLMFDLICTWLEKTRRFCRQVNKKISSCFWTASTCVQRSSLGWCSRLTYMETVDWIHVHTIVTPYRQSSNTSRILTLVRILCCDYSTLWEALHVNMVEIGARFSDENVKILVSYQWIGWKRRTKMVGE